MASRDPRKAEAFASEFGGLRAHGSYEALLDDPEIDAIYIATPHTGHSEWAIRAFEAGKAVLCEKPLAPNAAEARVVIEEARRQGAHLTEAYMWRFHPRTARLKELLRSGVLGEPLFVHAAFGFAAPYNPEGRLFHPGLAGGGILDVGGYVTSAARFVAGAVAGVWFEEPHQVTGAARKSPEGIDLLAAGTLRFRSGLVAEISCAVGAHLGSAFEIIGSEARIEVPNPWVAGKGEASETEILIHRPGSDPERLLLPAGPSPYALEADAVAEALAHGEQETAPMSWEDTLGNLHTLDGWRQACGIDYPNETGAEPYPTAHRRPLRNRTDPNLRFVSFPWTAKKAAQLVMGPIGCPRVNLPHLAALFDDYVERGGNAFDMAYIYAGGKFEKLLGQWMASRGNREELFLLAKGAHAPLCRPEVIEKQLDESLERMQTDYADLYFLHRDNPEIPASEFVDVLSDLVARGRIHAFGGSNWSPERIDAANRYAKETGRTPFQAVSNNFSLARMIRPVWPGCVASSEPAAKAWHERTGMPLFAWSSQARGFFTDRSAPDKLDEKIMVDSWYSEDNFERKRRAVELATQKGVEPISIALAYVVQQAFPTLALIGPRHAGETEGSFRGLAVELNAEERAWLNLER